MDTYMRSKLCVPGLGDLVVPRRQLFAALDSALSNRAVFVSAPAGYGKTTAVTAWLRERGLECAWVSLDEDDDSPGRLLQYLCAAAGRYLPDTFRASEADPYALLEKLLYALQDCGREFVIALDDFHHMADPVIFHLLLRFMQYKPPSVHLIITSRGEIPLAFQPALLKQQIALVKDDQLLFDREEVRQFFQLRQVALDPAQTEALMRQTEGWPCALVALSLALPPHIEKIPSLESNAFIQGFLLNEVWRQWDGETRDFLIQTSLLNEFSIELAQTVTRMERCADILERISTNRGFVVTSGGRERWYRYHHVFREFLQKMLAGDSRYDGREILSRAASYYRDSGDIVRALSYYRAAEDHQGILEIIVRDSAKLFLSVGAAEIIRIIDGMPRSALQNLRVCVCYGWALAFTRTETEAVPFIEFIQKQLKKQRFHTDRREAERVRREIAALSFVFNMRAGNHAKMIRNLTAIFARPELDCIVFSPLNILLIFGYQFGYQYTLLNTIFGFFGCVDAYVDFMEKTRYIAYSFMQRPALRMTGAMPVGRAEVLYQSGGADEALPYLSQGLDEAGRHGIAHVYLPGMLCLADIQKAGGDVAGAYRTAQECRAKLKELDEISAGNIADAYIAQLDLKFNRMDEVRAWEESAQISPFDDVVSFHAVYPYFTLVWVLVKTGRGALAHLLLNKIKKLLESFPIPNYSMFVYFLSAHLAFCEGKTQETCAALLQLLRTGHTYGYARFFADCGQDMRDLLALGIREKIDEMPDGVPPEYIRRLLAMTDETIEKTGQHLKQPHTADALGITPREREILASMARNLTNQEIADALYLSLQTVKNHTSSIYRKLGVASRMQAVSAARQMGLISS